MCWQEMVRSKVIEGRKELSFRQIAGSAKDHNGAWGSRLRSRTCIHTNSVSWINFDVATELIAHGRQHFFGNAPYLLPFALIQQYRFAFFSLMLATSSMRLSTNTVAPMMFPHSCRSKKCRPVPTTTLDLPRLARVMFSSKAF